MSVYLKCLHHENYFIFNLTYLFPVSHKMDIGSVDPNQML